MSKTFNLHQFMLTVAPPMLDIVVGGAKKLISPKFRIPIEHDATIAAIALPEAVTHPLSRPLSCPCARIESGRRRRRPSPETNRVNQKLIAFDASRDTTDVDKLFQGIIKLLLRPRCKINPFYLISYYIEFILQCRKRSRGGLGLRRANMCK